MLTEFFFFAELFFLNLGVGASEEAAAKYICMIAFTRIKSSLLHLTDYGTELFHEFVTFVVFWLFLNK